MLPPANIESLGHSVGGPRLNARQLEILQHALGVDQYGQGQMYRNHFCAGGADEDVCCELVELGFMQTFTRSWLPYYNCTVTESGRAAMLAESPKPPKLTRAQQRYRRYLHHDSGLSFREWLKWYGTANARPTEATSAAPEAKA